jgi:hypothetical protein
VHGLVHQFVAERAQEIGVRLAISVRPRGIVRLVTMRGTVPTALSLAIGATCAMTLARVLASLL